MSRTQISQPAAPVRESWRVLPGWLQGPLTLLSGKPYLGQKPWRRTAAGHLALGAALLALGLALGAAGPLAGGLAWLAVPLGWVLAVHGARSLQLLALHQASHQTFAPGRPWLNTLVGEAISIALQIQAFAAYRREHTKDHHSKSHMSERDPTVAFLFRQLGLRPGMPRRQAWRQLLLRLLSPAFHARLLLGRLRSSFGPGAGWLHRVLSALYLGSVLAAVAWSGHWLAFLTAVVVPLTLLYNVASTLRMCTEHRFPAPALADRYSREALASFSSALFVGDPAPDPGLPRGRRLLAWAGWWARLLFLHLPGRLLILPGDAGPAHDLHHRRPSLASWSDYVFERQRDMEGLRPDEWPPYTETWGSVFTAIDEVFTSLEKTDPAGYPDCRQAA